MPRSWSSRPLPGTLGGGCEIAMMCDALPRADNARFDSPRLPRHVQASAGAAPRPLRRQGQSVDLCLTGE
jgi:enoyl-CoA hydratase/carnithine racemase